MNRFLPGALLVAIAAISLAGERVNNLKVVSDRIEDVTTAENILHSFVKPSMNDTERAKALWMAAVKYRHQTVPPNEQLASDWEVHDPVKIFNVYGYCMCCCCSALIESLNRLDGREARGRILNNHSVPEVRDASGWHMYDCSLLNYFPKTDGNVASVDEISDSIKGWLEKHPELRGNNPKLVDFMRTDGWMGYKKGPELLASNPFYHVGYWPAGTHGWDSTMQEYAGKNAVYEYGYQLGHRALFSLRPGESFTREAGNRGLHINGKRDWDGLKAKAPDGDLVYVKQFFPGYHGSVVGNGVHRYAPEFASGGLAPGADVFDNLVEGTSSPALHPRVTGKPAVAIVQMSSPYVYLDGRVQLKLFRKTDAGQISLSISTNNCRDFQRLWTAEKFGMSEATIELKDHILRRYAYWLKIELTASSPTDAGLDGLVIENDFQHAPRSLPWLGKGENKITVAADGDDTTTATRTIACRNTDVTTFTKNETGQTMGVTYENVQRGDGSCMFTGKTGYVTVPVETPGDMIALRFGAQIRARESTEELVRMQLSFDDGKSWEEGGKLTGPTQGVTGYFRADRIPAGTRKALVRYALEGRPGRTVVLFNFRVDADYRDPLAATQFRPFTVTHRWEENGQERTASRTVARLPFTYNITTAGEPEMLSVHYEMAK